MRIADFRIKEKYFLRFMIGFIIIWPIINSFFGIDMVDTGYYLYQYENPLSDYGVYTTFFATLIGGVWLKAFGGLGLWGLNLLEIFLEWLLCFCVYTAFKKEFGRCITMVGCVINMILISTYVNIFNYHQLNMFLCTLLLCFMYKGLRKEKIRFLIVSGIFGMLAVFTRMPSILTLVCVLCIFYWGLFIKKKLMISFRYIAGFLLGYLITASGILLFLKRINKLEVVLSEVFRLNSLGKNGGAAYGSDAMISNFITDNIYSILAALVFGICVMVFIAVFNWQNQVNGKAGKVIKIMTGILLLPVIWLAIYKVGQAPEFVQLTSFNWFLYGICFCISMIYILGGIVNRSLSWNGLLMLMSIALILLCCVGSATRLKHVFLGMWFIVPFFLNQIQPYWSGEKNLSFHIKNRKTIQNRTMKETIVYFSIIGIVVLIQFVASTNNFDSSNRAELKYKVNSSKLCFLRTTERQANAMNDVLDVLKDKKEEKPLMVLGNAVIFYYLSDMDSYVKPWVSGTSYDAGAFGDHLYKEITLNYRSKPVIVWSKTNSYNGYAEEDYEELLVQEVNNNYSGKRQIAEEFMDENGYQLIFQNDYFSIYDYDTE